MTLDFDYAAASRRVFAAVERQQDLADVLGLSPLAISYLKHQRKCTLDLVLAACEVTGKPAAWFLYGKSEAADFRAEARVVAEATERSAKKVLSLVQRSGVGEAGAEYEPGTVSERVVLLV